jgi:hypothetical protein
VRTRNRFVGNDELSFDEKILKKLRANEREKRAMRRNPVKIKTNRVSSCAKKLASKRFDTPGPMTAMKPAAYADGTDKMEIAAKTYFLASVILTITSTLLRQVLPHESVDRYR